MRIALIAAVARNRVIGRAGALPWRLPADLRHFRAVTMGKPLVMGRTTYRSIGRALPGRTTIVVTRDVGWRAAGVEVAHDLDAALGRAAAIARRDGADEVMVAGGGEVYGRALARADRIYLTEVDLEVAGDAHFPDFDRAGWRITALGAAPAAGDAPACRFLRFDRA